MNVYIGEPVEYNDMQWPCPAGFHVPLKTEWQAIYTAGVNVWAWITSWDIEFSTYLKLPKAGYSTWTAVGDIGSSGYYWSSSPSSTAGYAHMLYFYLNNIYPQFIDYRYRGCPIRCFKDSPVIPTSSWTTLYQWSWNAWIYHNATEWLISISSDWTTWITIQDKNLWATTVYNYWDTLSVANTGNTFQWWNNYSFPSTSSSDSITTSTTQVDTTWYWPWNYYSSSTFIKISWDWSNPANDNLRWWVSQWTSTKSTEVKNIYIGDGRIYKGEYIEYKMNADSNGNLYVPVWWFNISWSINNTYDWYVSVDGWSATNYSWTWSSWWSITLSWYVAWTNHTIKIVPTTVDYRWARAYWWKNTPWCTFLTEIVYDASYMWYAYDASSVWGYFRANQYYGCTSITKPADEYLPDGVETISSYFRYCQYYDCSSLLFSPEEFLPDTVTTIWSNFRRYQYYSCSALTNIKWWKDLSIWNGNYRNSQYYGCTSNKTVKVLSDVWYDSYSSDTLENAYVTSVSVPSQYLSNFTSTNNNPRVNITDSKFIWY